MELARADNTNPMTATKTEPMTRTMPADVACQACGTRGLTVFYEAPNVPVHSCMLLESREAALAFPTGDLRLAFCPDCGFIGNLAYDGRLQNYAPGYEEQQSFSPYFNDFARGLATQLIERNNIRGKK